MKTAASKPRLGQAPVWCVIKIWRGIPTDAKVFASKAAALRKQRRWRNSINPMTDEIVAIQTDMA